MAYWFHLQYGVDPATLGAIFFAANLLAAVSSLLAAPIAARIGLINTMVFTHLPSNVLLILVPLMPNLQLAVAVLLLRFTLSQMDVPTRQSYVMAVVDPDERSAAAGVTGVARTTGAALSPSISSVLIASAGYAALPFYLAGGFKIVYDLLIYREFRAVKPPEEAVSVCASRPARLDDPEPDPGEHDHDEDRDDRVLEPLEPGPDRLPVRAELDPGEHEQRRPRQPSRGTRRA